MNKHKAKCDKLKKIRKAIADKLDIDLHQVECTYEGNCTGTCPKCKQEEEILNREIMCRTVGIGAAGVLALSLAGCTPTNGGMPSDAQGGMTSGVYVTKNNTYSSSDLGGYSGYDPTVTREVSGNVEGFAVQESDNEDQVQTNDIEKDNSSDTVDSDLIGDISLDDNLGGVTDNTLSGDKLSEDSDKCDEVAEDCDPSINEDENNVIIDTEAGMKYPMKLAGVLEYNGK